MHIIAVLLFRSKCYHIFAYTIIIRYLLSPLHGKVAMNGGDEQERDDNEQVNPLTKTWHYVNICVYKVRYFKITIF